MQLHVFSFFFIARSHEPHVACVYVCVCSSVSSQTGFNDTFRKYNHWIYICNCFTFGVKLIQCGHDSLANTNMSLTVCFTDTEVNFGVLLRAVCIP